MHEGLEGVVVGMTGVPLPLALVLVGSEVSSTPVVCQAAEPKETPVYIKRYDRGMEIKAYNIISSA